MPTRMVRLQKRVWAVDSHEYPPIHHPVYTSLRLVQDWAGHDHLIGFLTRLAECARTASVMPSDPLTFYSYGTTHGGVIPILLRPVYDEVVCVRTPLRQVDLIRQNDPELAIVTTEPGEGARRGAAVVFSMSEDDYNDDNDPSWMGQVLFVVSPSPTQKDDDDVWTTVRLRSVYPGGAQWYVRMRSSVRAHFGACFRLEPGDDREEEEVVVFENLIHLCIMVKDAGDGFEEMLRHNLPYIDEWTILDTGSTDGTIETVHRVLDGVRPGRLVEEPFINFRDSRNRLLDLAGTRCRFVIMLDDSYYLHGDLRAFLREIRSDQFADTFQVFIRCDAMLYTSNRILKSHVPIRYEYKIHEILSVHNNVNVMIPRETVWIEDRTSAEHTERTQRRAEQDIRWLLEELEDAPTDPRPLYYLGQTYRELKQYETAVSYYRRRVEHPMHGFFQERVDALFEWAFLSDHFLHRPWEECEPLYQRLAVEDPTRPEACFFLGYHALTVDDDTPRAYAYWKKAFSIGFPEHAQYSLRRGLSYESLPLLLARVCYGQKDYRLGYDAADLFLQGTAWDHTDRAEMQSWKSIYEWLLVGEQQAAEDGAPVTIVVSEKPVLCFVADGGFSTWSGETITSSGVGGAETYIIEMASHIHAMGDYDVHVFCNIPSSPEGYRCFRGVRYHPLKDFARYIKTHYVHHCIVSRFSQYVPLACAGYTENVHLVLHDLLPSGNVIPLDTNLRTVICLTDWHKDHFLETFPDCRERTVVCPYGMDPSFFPRILTPSRRLRRFVYSSMPDRGLVVLLAMWPRIRAIAPDASLDIFGDIDSAWCHRVQPTMMREIHGYLKEYGAATGIRVHGWVSKKRLAQGYHRADILFYPCTFRETYCLTAMEAAISRTLVVTTPLAALRETVGDRGILLEGDPTTTTWQDHALEILEDILLHRPSHDPWIVDYLDRNETWARGRSWASQAAFFNDRYLCPRDMLETKGVYDWTHDVPRGESAVMDGVLSLWVSENISGNISENISDKDTKKTSFPLRVLELGTHTGTSLIGILKRLPEGSTGIGIDRPPGDETEKPVSTTTTPWVRWKQNLRVDDSFQKNMGITGLTDRVTRIVSHPSETLLKWIRKGGIVFDWIHVRCEDDRDTTSLMVEIFLAWQLLSAKGMMAIGSCDTTTLPPTLIEQALPTHVYPYTIVRRGCHTFLQKVEKGV